MKKNLTIKINNKVIGQNNRVFIIAEVGINHEGSYEKCRQLINKAQLSGADAVKLQIIDADENYAKKSKFYKLFKKSFLSKNKIYSLYKYAMKKKICLFSTIGDLKTLKWVNKIKQPAYKISSGLFTHYQLLNELSKKKNPIILSTGFSNIKEIKYVFNYLKKRNKNEIAFMHCCSLYPAPKDKLNLSNIKFLKDLLNVPIGFSDHSKGYEASILAVASGADLIEKHFTLDKKRKSFDHNISLNPKEFKIFVKKIRETETILGKCGEIKKYIKKNDLNLLRRCILAKRKISKGKIITKDDVTIKRPEKNKIGIDTKYIEKIIGKRVNLDLDKDDPITFSCLNGKKKN